MKNHAFRSLQPIRRLIMVILLTITCIFVQAQTANRPLTPVLNGYNFVSCDTLKTETMISLVKKVGSNTAIKGLFYPVNLK